MATDNLTLVQGVNPNTGAAAGLIEAVADDDVLTALTLALRAMPTGSFQAVNGDLRSAEASARAAVALSDMFAECGLEFRVKPAPKAAADVPATDGKTK